jgi:Low-density lipoprotein receptor domain class A
MPPNQLYPSRCDNIKDCAQGEDENECKFCERDEFRCLSNDKCIPDKWRCDQYDDCLDGSDESDCFDDESRGFPTSYGNGRVYPHTQELQVPNDPKDKLGDENDRAYFTISNDDRMSAEDKTEPYESPDGDKYISIAAENIASIIHSNSTDGFAKRMDEENLEIQKSEESGRGLTYAPAKNLSKLTDIPFRSVRF